MTELDQLHFDDLKADLASAVEQQGARAVLLAFKESYPNHYNEIATAISRLANPKHIPVLLVKRDV